MTVPVFEQSQGDNNSLVDALLQDTAKLHRELYGYGVGPQDDLEDFAGSVTSFSSYWRDFLVENAEGLTDKQVIVLTRVAYNVAVSVEDVITNGPRYCKPCLALPSSGLREGLGFNDDHYRILHGTLSKPPSEDGFYDTETVGDMVLFVFNDLVKDEHTA
jgi:hypothetical protein